MNITAIHKRSTHLLTVSLIAFLSVLLAAYGPMTIVSHAQAASDVSQLQQLKKKVTDEIDKRIKNFEETLTSLGTSITAVTGTTSSTASPSPSSSVVVGKSGLEATVVFPGDLKTKAKDSLEKIIAQLKTAKEKANSTTSLASMESLADNMDAQNGVSKLTNVQAAVTQSIQSLTGVFGNLKTTATSVQSQITQLKDCVSGATESSSVAQCDGLNTKDGTTTSDSAQAQIDNISTVMSTIASVLASSIVLLTALLSTFAGMAGGVGGLGNLSSLTSVGDLSKLTSGLGGVSGLLTSFTGMASQLDIAQGMSGNASGLLGNLTKFISL